MRRHLLITTAAVALAAGTMFAAAQGTQRQGGGESGAQGQMPQSKQPMTKGQAQGQPEKGKAQSKEPTTRGQGGQVQGQPEKGKAKPKEPQTRGQGQPQRTEGQREDTKQPKSQTQREDRREGQKGSEGTREQKGAKGKDAGGSGGVKLTQEQRTKIRTSVIQSGNAPRVTNVNFNISVGTVVPRSVRVVAVPTVLVEIYPQWRGHRYFIVGERIIIVDSGYRIVAVLVV
jgi:hypothetical protein